MRGSKSRRPHARTHTHTASGDKSNLGAHRSLSHLKEGRGLAGWPPQLGEMEKRRQLTATTTVVVCCCLPTPVKHESSSSKSQCAARTCACRNAAEIDKVCVSFTRPPPYVSNCVRGRAGRAGSASHYYSTGKSICCNASFRRCSGVGLRAVRTFVFFLHTMQALCLWAQ